jgi:hypothetical protein
LTRKIIKIKNINLEKNKKNKKLDFKGKSGRRKEINTSKILVSLLMGKFYFPLFSSNKDVRRRR